MATLYEVYTTDESLEQGEGIDLEFGDTVFEVRRAGGRNREYQAELRKLTRPLRRQIENDLMTPDQYMQILRRVFARTVVLGWRHKPTGKPVITTPQGELEFNEANFLKVMSDLPDLWDQIFEQCTQMSNFRHDMAVADGELLGNS